MRTAPAWARLWLVFVAILIGAVIVIVYFACLVAGMVTLWGYSPLLTLGVIAFVITTICAGYEAWPR